MSRCVTCKTPCVQRNNRAANSTTIHGHLVMACAYSDSLPTGDLSEIMDGLQDKVRHAQQQLSLPLPDVQNAFNNVRGAWTRHVFSYISWNKFCENSQVGNSCIVTLPSITSLRFTDLFDPEASTALSSGLLRRLSNQGIELRMSNPDFVCISDITPEDMQGFAVPVTNLSLQSQEKLDTAYKKIKGCCSYSALKFGVALKTSLRSDRRYQVAYEGSILKALIAHLQVRFWDTSFDTHYYAVVANKVSSEDRTVLTAPATHSIIDVHTPPVKAIDEIYEVKSTYDIESCIQKMIELSFIKPLPSSYFDEEI